MEELASIMKWEATPQPVNPDPRAFKQNFSAKLCYVVVGVLWSEEQEEEERKVLLIQEAKASCREEWYLPAGRVEPNETLPEAVKREVLEESGLEFEPAAVIAVENRMMGSWTRITFTGKVTGGCLKTKDRADKESLQARWFSPQHLTRLNLRSSDILPLIEIGGKWYRDETRHRGLPPAVGHVCSRLRLILIHDSGSQLMTLIHTKSQSSMATMFPVSKLAPHFMEEAIRSCGYHGDYKLHGLLSLEHLGRPTGMYDGICISVLLTVTSKDLNPTSDYQWEPVEYTLVEALTKSLQNPVKFFQF